MPNFRNLGILLRILLVVNMCGIGAAIVGAPTLAESWQQLLAISAVLQPLLIVVLLALVSLDPLLRRLPYYLGAIGVGAIVLAAVAVIDMVAYGRTNEAAIAFERHAVLALITVAMLLSYFNLRGRALSPALSEARLQALQARIRPHFLYNSINAVLSLIRQEPRRAETALEDLADLFRVVMGDNRELAPISREVELCRQYLGLEQLRLGDRLRVVWRVDKMPSDALMPPLVLQPLLENAVYHGIEPRVEPGEISIDIYSARNQVHAVLKNPYAHEGNHHGGNKMALNNIRERLQLHFDAEATLETRVGEDTYQVHITMPYLKSKPA
ncbi:MAG TPA: histidine kinase [Burkholderiales bacterium]|nr:histidine kinase [Burkholderiales bacterium]